MFLLAGHARWRPQARRGGLGDKRFGRAFIYHNTADCYYASRG
ncbi:DUF4256 domain-containing protein [Limosilactobacillus fermentum]